MGKSSVSGNYEEYRTRQMENGQRFQDFAADALYAAGYPITTYSSRLYQLNVGESRGGWEFKHDMKRATTGNIWIEISEKARPRAGDYVPSGIYARSNTVFYVIGDYDRFFVFVKKHLVTFHATGKYRIMENGTKTSQGYLMNEADAHKFAILILEPKLSKAIKGAAEQMKRQAHELYRTLEPDAASFCLPLPFDK